MAEHSVVKEKEDCIVEEILKARGLDFNDNRTFIFIDGDIIAWIASASTDGRQYSVGKEIFKYHKDAVTYCKVNKIPVTEIFKTHKPEPVSHALHNVKTVINGIVTNVTSLLNKQYPDTLADRVIVPVTFLSSNRSFRKELINDKYKANREGTREPAHLVDCKQYMVTNGAIVVDPFEADDLIGISATIAKKGGAGYVTASIDKDLQMIDGLYYHIHKKELSEISIHEGLYNFALQVLQGDTADNIEGLRGVGPKTAVKLLAPFSKDNTDIPIADFYNGIMQLVYNAYKKKGKGIKDLIETARQLWIMRRSMRPWVFPVNDKIQPELKDSVNSTIITQWKDMLESCSVISEDYAVYGRSKEK